MTEAAIAVRKPALDFEQPIARFYFAGNPIKTHVFNALNLLFPDGERFFVKSVHDHEKDVHDPALLRDMKAFAGQEGQHAYQHERFFAVLEQQGYRFALLLEQFRGLARWSRVLPRSLRLSITAGAEHYTATMAALLLEHDMLEGCDPTLRDLIMWHAVEEIEHKHVAYDVLVKVYRFSSYPLRIVGFIAASAVIALYTGIGLRLLLRQDGRARRLSRAQFDAARRALAEGKELSFRRSLRRALARYLMPGFHPNQKDDRALLTRYVPLIKVNHRADGRAALGA
jgi:predicted metal-dependent hydrolase